MFKDENEFRDFINDLPFDDGPDPAHREQLQQQLLRARDEKDRRQAETNQKLWRSVMRNKITKIAAAAVIVIAGIAGIISFTTSSPAYAIEDTIEAVKNIQFLHLIMRDDQENIVDERWIEIGPDGQQQRYRQENNYMELNLLYVNDGATRFFHDPTKNEVALNGPLMQFYGGDFWNLFDEIASDLSTVVEENAEYQGQRAHHVRWSNSQMDCFIDPETLLPLAIGSYDVFYEEPPAGIFDIPAIPAGAKVVDELKFEQEVDSWVQIFSEAKTALAEGKNLEAAELLEQAVDLQPLANEAWIWLGEAYFRMGQYEKAIETYTHLIDLFEGLKLCPMKPILKEGWLTRFWGKKKPPGKILE